jgi:uncharacterized iron-regulated membrane protein
LTQAFPAASAERRRPRARDTVKRVHRWLSLAVAAVWLVQAISGMLIVFHWEINDALVPGEPRPVDIAAVSRQIDSLPRQAGPGWSFSSIWVTAGKPDRFNIYIDNEPSGDSRTIRIAGDGTILNRKMADQEWSNGGWTGKLVVLHHNLLAGDTGSWIIGISGMLLLSNIFLGLKLAWPKARTWRKSLLPGKMKAGPGRTYAWHRAVGLWMALPALITVSCGTMLVFDPGLRKMLGAGSGEITAPPSAAPIKVGTEQAIRTAIGRFAGSSLVALYPPSQESPWYDILLLQPNELRRAYGKTQVIVDARTGAVLKTHDPATAEPARAFMDSLFPIHTGEAGGIPGRLLVMLIGLALATMVVLGARLWWVRRR